MYRRPRRFRSGTSKLVQSPCGPCRETVFTVFGLLGLLVLRLDFARAVYAHQSRMVFCPQCYQITPICNHGDDPNQVCTGFTPDANASRLTDGSYAAAFTNTLPSEIRSTDGVHLDNLSGYTAATPALDALTAEETDMSADLNLITMTTMGTALALAGKRPAMLTDVRRHIMALLNGTPSAAQSQLINTSLSQLNDLHRDHNRSAAGAGSVASTTIFKATNYPLATLFQNVVKGVERGFEVTPDAATEMLDTQTGKKYIPFEKSTKVTSAENFMYSAHVFVTGVLAIKKESPQVYFPFTKELKRACSSGGFLFAQQYADALLRALDDGLFKNPVALFQSGEQNRIFAELWANRVLTPKEKTKDPDDPRRKIKFGPVTQPLGGKGAGVVTDYKTKAKIKCNRFHAVPQQPCTAGVPAGDNRFTPDQVGLCAYCH